MGPPSFMGFTYDPLRDQWSLDPDTSVNYLASSVKPSAH
jgi:2-polyprenyl-3-methyl-5-hydroxy-6-metoxy-1,4-benzoquinol methylase